MSIVLTWSLIDNIECTIIELSAHGIWLVRCGVNFVLDLPSRATVLVSAFLDSEDVLVVVITASENSDSCTAESSCLPGDVVMSSTVAASVLLFDSAEVERSGS